MAGKGNRQERRAALAAATTQNPESSPDKPDETLPITDAGWVGEPLTAPDEWVDAQAVRESGFVSESQFPALWPAFTGAHIEGVVAKAHVPCVELDGEKLYRVGDVADALSAWFKSACFRQAADRLRAAEEAAKGE